MLKALVAELPVTLLVMLALPIEVLGAAASYVRIYLAKEIKKLISIREFNDALPGHLPPDAASQERAGTIISRLEGIASL